MTWLQFLYHTNAVVQIVANVTVIFCVFPAYRLTRQRAFLFIFCASLLGIFDTICDHTIGRDPMAHADFIAYRTLRSFTYYLDVGFSAAGVILLARSYLSLLAAKAPNSR